MTTPPAEAAPRRHRGIVAVLIVVLAGALAIVPVFFLRPPVAPGPDIVLVIVTDNITASPATTPVNASFGPFCTQFAWNPGTRILAVQADLSLSGVEGIAVVHYVEDSPNFASAGGDRVSPAILLRGGMWMIESPVDGHTLATLVPSGGNVTVGGTTYVPGASWSMHFAYDATTPHGTVHLTEDLSLENLGTVSTRTVPVESCI